jgi:hypothetical protein
MPCVNDSDQRSGHPFVKELEHGNGYQEQSDTDPRGRIRRSETALLDETKYEEEENESDDNREYFYSDSHIVVSYSS